MQVAWEFDYNVDSTVLANLYERAKALQWNAETDIDWDIAVDPSSPIIDEQSMGYTKFPFYEKLSQSQQETLRAHVAASNLSQFLHGEQGALMTAATLAHSVPDYEAKLYSATQTMDEARHVEVFEKYLRKIAIVYPISPFLKAIIDATISADHWVKTAIGMNVIIEGLAVGSFYNMRKTTGCELLRSIVELTARDEARHVAFGNVYVREALRKMHPDDREDAADFALAALTGMAVGSARTDEEGKPRRRFRVDPGFAKMLESLGIDPTDWEEGIRKARESGIRVQQRPGTLDVLRDLVMPALVRTGAITDRTRKILEERGVTVWDDTSKLEMLEDETTGIIELQD
jgi:hypothetical protein